MAELASASTARKRVRSSWLNEVNPVTGFVAAVLYTVPMLTTIDVVSAGVALVLWLALFTVAGISPRTILGRTWPLYIAAPVSMISMLLYAVPGGRTYWEFWLATISDNSIELSVAIGLRVLAVGIPTLVVLAGLDPTRLADALGQVAKLPARFVLGALAGVRLFGVLGEDWRQLALARRARGLGDGGRIRRTFSMAFALLVIAIRRGEGLATAMEARGLGNRQRTWARPSTLGARDLNMIIIALMIPAVALGASIVTGSFRLLGT